MLRLSITVNLKLLFWHKRCPVCGNKMRIFFKKIQVSEKERLEAQERIAKTGKPVALNGKLKLFEKVGCLKCLRCKMVLDDKSFIKVRKLQKQHKSYILTHIMDVKKVNPGCAFKRC